MPEGQIQKATQWLEKKEEGSKKYAIAEGREVKWKDKARTGAELINEKPDSAGPMQDKGKKPY